MTQTDPTPSPGLPADSEATERETGTPEPESHEAPTVTEEDYGRTGEPLSDEDDFVPDPSGDLNQP